MKHSFRPHTMICARDLTFRAGFPFCVTQREFCTLEVICLGFVDVSPWFFFLKRQTLIHVFVVHNPPVLSLVQSQGWALVCQHWEHGSLALGESGEAVPFIRSTNMFITECQPCAVLSPALRTPRWAVSCHPPHRTEAGSPPSLLSGL